MNATPSPPTYTIGQFAALTGLTPRALRLYERAGLLVPRRHDNNYRLYGEPQVHEAAVIQELRAAGLSVAAIQRLFAIKRGDAPPADKLRRALAVLDDMRETLAAKHAAIEAALRRIDADRRDILTMLEEVGHGRPVDRE